MTYRLLVVDDELPALDEMEQLLKEEPLAGEVVFYSHAERALEWAIAHEPDIVLLDIQMPGVTGLSFAERLHEARPSIEVVFVTAYQQYALQAFDLSAVDYILKPVKPERLNQTLNRIHRRRMGGAEQLLKQRAEVEPEVQGTREPIDLSSEQLAREQGQHLPSIYSLGRLRIESSQGSVKWRTVKVEELFAYLLFKGSVSLEQIIDDVFANFEPDKAKTYIHTCVYQIRRAIAEMALQEHIHISYRDRVYTLNVVGVWQDREQFGSEPTEPKNFALLEERISLYVGDWCDGLDGMWMMAYREELRDRYVWLMEDIIVQLRGMGDYRRAIANARKLLTLDPWNERYAARIAELYIENGEKARARQFIEEYKGQYEREMEEAISDPGFALLEGRLA